MKGLIALVVFAVLGGCASLQGTQPASTAWTHWVCDSKAEVYWRYANPAKTGVEARLNQSEQVFPLKVVPGSSGTLFSNGVLAFHVNGDEGLVYWEATNDLIGRGCKAAG